MVNTEERIENLRAELVRRIAFSIGREERLTTKIEGLSLHRRTTPTVPCPTTYEPSIVVVAQGRKRVDLGGKAFLYGEDRYLLTSLSLPSVSRVVEGSEAKPCLAMMLKFDMHTVRELLSREVAPTPQNEGGTAMASAEITAELLDACCRLLDLLNVPTDIEFLSDLIQREIIYRVLCGSEGARLRSIATVDDQHSRTARAIAWISANYSRPLRMEELAKTSGLGVSTLHHQFRTLTAMSPLQYQKKLRLHAARGRMLMDGVDAATAAFEVGYESPSQFNREYSRMFGLPPMRDIRMMRSPDAPVERL